MTLGEILKQRRAELQLSQPELAQVAAIEQSYLSKIENDRSLPSNEVYRRLLAALELSQKELLSHFDSSYIQARLRQIPDVNEVLQRSTVRQQKRQRFWLISSAVCLALSLPVFYTGFMATLFPEKRFEYESQGIVLPDESAHVFHNWSLQFDPFGSEARNEMLQHMYERRDEHRINTYENRGRSYVKHLPDDLRRNYVLVDSSTVQRPVNGLLQALGLLLAGLGVIGFVVERRLFKKLR